MMLSSVKLITRAFSRPSFLHHQLKHVPYRGFADAHSPATLKTIFVSQIPRDVTEEELKWYFPTCRSTRIIKDKLSGSSKRFGYVSFPTHEEAKEAVSKTVKIFGQSLKLDFAKKKSQRKLRARGTLFVSHLPHDMNEAELQSLFPDSIAVRIIFNRSTGLSKGYGFVGFHTPEAAKEQVKKNGMEIRRRKLFIDFDSSRQQYVDEDMQQEPFELKDDLDSDMSWDDSLTEK